MTIKEFSRPFDDSTMLMVVSENDYTYSVKTVADLKSGPLGNKELKKAKMSEWAKGLELIIAGF